MKKSELEVITQEEAFEAKKQAITEQVMSMEFKPEYTDIKVDMSKAVKVPLAEFTALGTAFASLPEAFRTVTQTVQVSGEGLYHVTDAAGKAIDASALFSFKDGTGLLGSFKDAAGNLSQARLNPAGPQVAEVATSIPYDPTSLFIAAALMEVNQKLDAIQETQQQMFDYLKSKGQGQAPGEPRAARRGHAELPLLLQRRWRGPAGPRHRRCGYLRGLMRAIGPWT